MGTKKTRPATSKRGRAKLRGTFEQRQSTTEKPARAIPVRRESDGRVVGEISGEPPVLRKRAAPEHRLRNPDAWGWDVSIIEQAERLGVRETLIESGGRIYRALISDFRRFGFLVQRGDTRQLALPLAHWTISRVGEPPAAVQLALLGDREP